MTLQHYATSDPNNRNNNIV